MNDYYIETRYPLDAPVDYSKKEAREALAAAERIGMVPFYFSQESYQLDHQPLSAR